MSVAVLKYNAGNVRSVSIALTRLGAEHEITDDHDRIRSASHVVLPGVGEASTAMRYLTDRDLPDLIAGLIVGGAGLVGQLNPIVVAAGCAILIRDINNRLSVRISERDASVFWGLIVAADDDGRARESDILVKTNEERREAGLDRISADNTRRGLIVLEKIGSIRSRGPTGKEWELIEPHQILEQEGK